MVVVVSLHIYIDSDVLLGQGEPSQGSKRRNLTPGPSYVFLLQLSYSIDMAELMDLLGKYSVVVVAVQACS